MTVASTTAMNPTTASAGRLLELPNKDTTYGPIGREIENTPTTHAKRVHTPTMTPKEGEMPRPPQAEVAPQFTRQRFSRRNAAAIASIGSPQIKIAIGLANELGGTMAVRGGRQGG